MLFLAKFDWRDGESEYTTCKGVVADDLDKAFKSAEAYLSDMWGSETVRQDGWFTNRHGFPQVRVGSVTGILDMEQLIREVGTVN